MKKWILVGLILLLFVNSVSAIEIYTRDRTIHSSGSEYEFKLQADIGTDPLNYIVYETITIYCPVGNNYADDWPKFKSAYSAPDDFIQYANKLVHVTPDDESKTFSASHSQSLTGWNTATVAFMLTGAKIMHGRIVFVTCSDTDIYNLTGYVNCVNNISIDINNGTDWVTIYYNDSNQEYDSYNIPIALGAEYRIKCDEHNIHQFTCSGDENFNNDACNYCTINICDNCANLLNNQVTLIDNNTTIIYSGHDNPINILPLDINENDELTVMWSTWNGVIYKTCFARFDYDINLFDPFVYWNMNVRVYDNESNPIENANVDFNQDCVINGYPTRNKYTDINGLASFTQCENDNADLTISKDGYKTLSAIVSGGWYNVYMSTYELSIILQSSDSEDDNVWDIINDSINDTNATEIPDNIPDVDGTPIDIHLYFKNTKGDLVTEINDSDNYVKCYYSVKTPDSVDMTLVFQKSFTGYYFYDIYEYPYSIDNNSYGYMNISNANFSDSDYSYRAYIYDVSYPFDDRYVYLNVVNQTNESETHYDNLTAYCMFMNTNKNGSIDYREDITCYACLFADTDTLKTVSMELYDETSLIDSKNLDWMDFIDDDIYGWYLGYNYTLNHNYSLVLKGYDSSILDVDNVIAKNIVGNKLTIKVTDTSGHDLIHTYVFVEHYGSINTGYLNYGAFEGLPNGESRYKASKTGYRTGAWGTINLTDENEIVSYQLIQELQEGSISVVRMSDNDVKDLYYPLMYFLGIILLLGALINVIK